MMNARLTKAVELIADLTKQLITLSTGIVTVTLLFSKDIFVPKHIAVWAWGFYLLSTILGLWALMALTGTLAPVSQSAPKDEDFPIKANIRIPSGGQIITFGIAVAFTIWYVFAAMYGPEPAPPPVPPPTVVVCKCDQPSVAKTEPPAQAPNSAIGAGKKSKGKTKQK
jgi:hypothetical protein